MKGAGHVRGVERWNFNTEVYDTLCGWREGPVGNRLVGSEGIM